MTGATGPTGATGAEGTKGASGESGATGATGVTGAEGKEGKAGATGATVPAGPTGAQGKEGKAGATGVTGATGATGAEGKEGKEGKTGATGAAGAGGHVATFMVNAMVKAPECLGNALFDFNNQGPCPVAVAAFAYTPDVRFLEGPVPNGGGTVTNLVATMSVAPAAGKQAVLDVVDNTTGKTLEKCTIAAGETHCTDSTTTPVSAGHYLEVKLDASTTAAATAWRVTFRY